MGALRMGPPFDIVLALKDAMGLRCFFETGTYVGDTTARAARHFARVVTVELGRVENDLLPRHPPSDDNFAKSLLPIVRGKGFRGQVRGRKIGFFAIGHLALWLSKMNKKQAEKTGGTPKAGGEGLDYPRIFRGTA